MSMGMNIRLLRRNRDGDRHPEHSPGTRPLAMDHLKFQQAFDRYLDLPADKNKVVVTYIFVDLLNNLGAKARTLDFEPKSPEGEFNSNVRILIGSSLAKKEVLLT